MQVHINKRKYFEANSSSNTYYDDETSNKIEVFNSQTKKLLQEGIDIPVDK